MKQFLTDPTIQNFIFWLLVCGFFVVFVAIENFARRRRNAKKVDMQPKTARIQAKATRDFEKNLAAAKAFITRRNEEKNSFSKSKSTHKVLNIETV